jgi:site-specific recombinase XerD
MSGTIITIFVRHTYGCKYAGDEFAKSCKCRKHLRWSKDGKQYRRKAGTRSWAEAERVKRDLEDQLSGRVTAKDESAQSLTDAVDVFLKDKQNQGVNKNVLGKYTRELGRFRAFCESRSVFTVQLVAVDMLTHYAATWPMAYPSSMTRSKVRERLRTFLRYCFQAGWLNRIPSVSKVKVDEPPTLPLTADEYKRLLNAVHGTVADRKQADRVHALFQLMRWSGLAIRDALTLKRQEITEDADGVYSIVTARQKTGTHVAVPIPPKVAKEVLAVLNGNAEYVFWSGNGEEESITKGWSKYYIAPVFKAAKIPSTGHMMSHRLRDTFAVDLLEKGVPLEEVSKLLGHESIKTTERHYAKWVKGRQDRLKKLVTATWK